MYPMIQITNKYMVSIKTAKTQNNDWPECMHDRLGHQAQSVEESELAQDSHSSGHSGNTNCAEYNEIQLIAGARSLNYSLFCHVPANVRKVDQMAFPVVRAAK